MRFHVLGAVDAVHAGHQVSLGHPRLRCVLAILLVDANRFVSVDQLMERIWGDCPPKRGREVLYTYLSRLRTALSGEHDVTIQRRSGGYLLTVDDASVDLHRFRGLIKQARLANDDARALALLDQALQLWRGTPFADLDTPWLASVRAALEVERRSAQLDRTDAALRCGQHAELLAELTTSAAQQPLDERIAGQLMLALAGAGRQAEALTAYQHTRQVLLGEIGLEPGAELRLLHERILTGNISPATGRAAGAPAVVPRQLPPATRHFTGRHAELDMLTRLLEPPADTVVISAIDGMAGIGKTTLAVHAAHQLADRFPDGVLFTDLNGFTPDVAPTLPEQVLDHLLRGLGLSGSQIPPDLDGRMGLYRSVLAGRRVLIVLDNAAHETQLQPLLPGSAGCRVIVTSRRHLAGLDDATQLTLPVLSQSEAADLFRSLAGQRATATDQAFVERIVTLCGRLPLAVRITAARLRLAPAASADTVCAELDDALDTGSAVRWLSDGHRAIGAALGVSYGHLTVQQQHAFRMAGLHPGPSIEHYALSALADSSVSDARRLLEELCAANLLHQTAHRRYALHDLVAAYAATLTTDLPEPDRHAALGRLYDHYAATSSHAVNLTRPWDASLRPRASATDTPTPDLADRIQAQAWLDTETDNLVVTAQHATTQRRADHTWHQSATLRQHLRTSGHYSQAALLHQHALNSARQTGNRVAEQDALLGLGNLHIVRGSSEPAIECFEQALASARQTGNHAAEQDALLGLGLVHHRLLDRLIPPAEYYELALASARLTGNRVAEQDALVGLGNVHYRQGHPTYGQDARDNLGLATEYYEKALAGARQIDNRSAEFDALLGLGCVHLLRGRYRQATTGLERALAGARQTGNRHTEQKALVRLGNVHIGQNRFGPATHSIEQALYIASQTGDLLAEQEALRNLGTIDYLQSRLGQARTRFEQALSVACDTDDRNEQFESHHGLGRVHNAAHHHEDALDHCQAALELAVEIDQPGDQARAYDGIAHAHRALGNPEQARHHWQAALTVLNSIGIDRTEERNVTTADIRAHLLDMGDPSMQRQA